MVFQLPSYLLPHPTIIANTTYADAIMAQNQTLLESHILKYTFLHLPSVFLHLYPVAIFAHSQLTAMTWFLHFECKSDS